MPPLPPAKDVLDALHHAVLPAAGGAALVVCLFALLGRRAAALGSAVAAVVGFGWANFTFDAVSWENTGRVIPWKADGPTPVWHWLPRAALVLVVVGLLSRGIGLLATHVLPTHRWWGANLLVWSARLAAVVVVSGWLVSEAAATESPWLRVAFPAVMLLSWVALDGVARYGAGAQVAAYQSAIFLTAGAILLYAHSARFMDLGVIVGCVMFGVAVAAGAAKVDASGAVPAGVGFLPGLMLNGRLLTESNVPVTAFWLVALAPLTLLPFLIPAVARQNRWLVISLRTVLLLAPLVVAVVLAAGHEKLVFEEW